MLRSIVVRGKCVLSNQDEVAQRVIGLESAALRQLFQVRQFLQCFRWREDAFLGQLDDVQQPGLRFIHCQFGLLSNEFSLSYHAWIVKRKIWGLLPNTNHEISAGIPCWGQKSSPITLSSQQS